MQESDQDLLEQGHKAIAEFLRENRQHLLDFPIRQKEMELLEIAIRVRPGQRLHKELAATLPGGKKELSTRKKELNKALGRFCRQFGIEPPIQVYFKSSVVHKAGTHLACSRSPNTNSSSEYVPLDTLQSVLDKAAGRLKVEHGAAGAKKDQIEATLRERLRDEASSHLRAKLNERKDYQSLEMEVGLPPDTREQSRAYRFCADNFPLPDHNRQWKPFARNRLLNMEGAYIISSDAGMGKTTFLRYLQLEILDRKALIPIFLHACEIENWEPDSTSDLIQHIVKKLDLRTEEHGVIQFLKDAFDNRRVVLLIDGLDQIQGVGTEYRHFIGRITRLSCGRLIIASRPSAVTSEEENASIAFLRLRPFDIRARRAYFSKHYDLARSLSRTCPELAGIPMLACMLRTLIENKETEDVSNRTALYRRFMKHIFMEYKHEEAKLSREFRSRARESLRAISYSALEQTQPLVQKIPLDFCLRQASVNIDDLQRYGIVNLLERSSGLDDYLCFIHQSFQEYLAAEWAADKEEKMAHILSEMWKPKWRQVIRFLAGLKGQAFVRRIYGPDVKDNCIHSRLFLAAECYGEIGNTCESEKVVFERLQELALQQPFESDSAASLSCLNAPEAVDFVIEKAIRACELDSEGKVTNPNEPSGDTLISFVKPRLLPRHIDGLLRRFGRIEAGHNSRDAIDLLAELAESLTTQHIDRIIDLYSCGKLWRPAGPILRPALADRVHSLHIDRILNLIAGGDERAKERLVHLLCGMIGSAADRLIRHRGEDASGYASDIDSERVLSAREMALRILPHVDRLIDWAEGCDKSGSKSVCHIVVHLAEIGVVTPRCIDWIIDTIDRGGSLCETIIFPRLATILQGLAVPDARKLVDYLIKHPDPEVTELLFNVDYPWAMLSADEAAEIVDAFVAKPAINGRTLWWLLERTLCVLAPAQMEKAVDALNTEDGPVLKAAWRALHRLVRDVSPIEINRAITTVKRIKGSIMPFRIRREWPDRARSSKLLCPFAKSLTENQVELIAGWLMDPDVFRLRWGISLLAERGGCSETTPPSYLRLISMARKALRDAVDRVKDSDIDTMVTWLNSRHWDVRMAAGACIRMVKDRLAESHVADIMRVVSDADVDVSDNALWALAAVPERVPMTALGMILRKLEDKKHKDYHVSDWVAEFSNRFGQKEVDALLSYARSENCKSRDTALMVLRHMNYVVPSDLLNDILQRTKPGGDSPCFLEIEYLIDVVHKLSQENRQIIVDSYVANPEGNELLMVIREIPPVVLAEHVDALVDLQIQQCNRDAPPGWGFWIDRAASLMPEHIRRFQELLGTPNRSDRYGVYYCLKETYSLCGLPS